MTKGTVFERNRDVAEYLSRITIHDRQPSEGQQSSKSPGESARLAQQLGSEAPWAERYVPATPSETDMTPSTSVADHGEAPSGSSYVTPDEAPPTYELATSSSSDREAPPDTDVVRVQRAELPSFTQSQLPSFVQSQPPDQISFPPGRHYERHETSQSINGTFTLYDSLDLSTVSGSIGIKVEVRPGLTPAVLKLKSNSGSITVSDRQTDNAQSHRHHSHHGRGHGESCCRGAPRNTGTASPLAFLFGRRQSKSTEVEEPPTPFSDDPRKQAGQGVHTLPGERQAASLQNGGNDVDEESVPRVIHATIETSSGSVNATLLLTAKSETHVTTNSGSINLRMVTSGSGARTLSKLEQEDSRLAEAAMDLTSVLNSQCGSGSQTVSITTGITDTSAGAIISSCLAKHRSTGSGSLGVRYPTDWTGLVHASCGGSGGSARVSGHGLEYDRRGNNEIYAWRGVNQPDISKAVQVICDNGGSVQFSC